MKLPLKSLKQYVNITVSPEDIVNILAKKIGEVEDTLDWSKAYQGIYVAEIREKKDHPEAEKLGVYKISLGSEETVQVVAGDKTLQVGNKVAYIMPGYIVPCTYNTPEEFKIKSMKMRGIESNGMLCSEKELNIGPDHTKVLVLPEDAPLGKTFMEYYQLDDFVINIENKALTNRGDLFGIIGLAREISAAQSISFESPDWLKETTLEYQPEKNCLALEIKNEAQNLCPRYMGIAMDNVEVKESPVWLKSILLKSGIRPINNIVDITNYLMVLTGQPLHAFDYDKLISKDPNADEIAYITIRLARDGERIHTLDERVVELNSNTLVIADSTNPIAIAGMIGGIETEIDNNTKRVVIECANFDRYNIRKSSMALGITTDAVTRFTRAQDPNQCLPVLGKAIELIQMLSDATIASNVIDIYPDILESEEITISIPKLNNHLGTNLSTEEITEILQNIEYEVLPQEGISEYITVVPPTFRRDIQIAEDIHEDIGRIYGYDNIKPKLPLRDLKPASTNSNIEIKKKIRSVLTNSGLNEIDTYNFVGCTLLEKAKQDPNICYKIKNSLSPELELMRPSILVSTLERAQQNVQRNIPTFGIYEFNIPHQKEYMDKFELPKEDWHMSLVFCDRTNNTEGNPYYMVKKYFERLIKALDIDTLEYELISESSETDIDIWMKNIINSFERNSSAVIFKRDGNNRSIVGVMGEINNEVKDNFKLPYYTSALEINLEVLKKIKPRSKKYTETSKYPPLTQDISFTVKDNVKYKDIKDIIERTISNRKTNITVECIDIFKKDNTDTKNITVRITVEHLERTLKDKDIEKSKQSIEKALEKLG